MVQCQALGHMKICLVNGLVLVLVNLDLIPALKNGKICYHGTKLIYDTTMCDVQ